MTETKATKKIVTPAQMHRIAWLCGRANIEFDAKEIKSLDSDEQEKLMSTLRVKAAEQDAMTPPSTAQIKQLLAHNATIAWPDDVPFTKYMSDELEAERMKLIKQIQPEVHPSIASELRQHPEKSITTPQAKALVKMKITVGADVALTKKYAFEVISKRRNTQASVSIDTPPQAAGDVAIDVKTENEAISY